MSLSLLNSLTDGPPDFHRRTDPPHIFRNNHQNFALAQQFTGMIPPQCDLGLGTLGLSEIGSSNLGFPGLSAVAMNRAVGMKRGMSNRDSSLLAHHSGASSDLGFSSASFFSCGGQGSCSSSLTDSDISTGSEVLGLSGLQMSPFFLPFSMPGKLDPHRMVGFPQNDVERGLEGASVGRSSFPRDCQSLPGSLDSLWFGWPGQYHMRDMYSIEQQAQLHRQAAAVSEATCTWSGCLPSHYFKNPVFSPKVFLGGVPWDMTEAGLINTFKIFGSVSVEWPGKDGKHPRCPPKGNMPKGYVYILFDSDKSVRALLQTCTHDFRNGGLHGDYYYKVSSRRMRSKEVQVIPWVVAGSDFVWNHSRRLEPVKTVFVGALHGMLNAEGLAKIMNDLFDGVVHAGIDTDKHRYPIGSGRVAFNNHKSFMKAVHSAFIEIKTLKFTKKACFKYYCKACWYFSHALESLHHHQPLTRNQKGWNCL
uniref:RRM domain-containing protein n=1 Tax=Eptatretus burgeri TaxID=7764 RepID=A0A8C4PWU7_EPTBU